MSTHNMSIFRMFCYNEQRNEAVARGRYRSKKNFFPHTGKKIHVFILRINDPVEGKTRRYRRKEEICWRKHRSNKQVEGLV